MGDDGEKLRTSLPTRRFGGTGVEVSITGLGGEGILRTHGQQSISPLPNIIFRGIGRARIFKYDTG